jgi:hypothetical protein
MVLLESRDGNTKMWYNIGGHDNVEEKLPITYENCDHRVSASFYGAVGILFDR